MLQQQGENPDPLQEGEKQAKRPKYTDILALKRPKYTDTQGSKRPKYTDTNGPSIPIP